MNNQEKYQLWLNQYKAIQSSGLSIERWAIQNNLPPSTVYSRIHRLCQLGLIPKTDELTPVIESDSSSSCFVEISVPDSIVPSSQVRLQSPPKKLIYTIILPFSEFERNMLILRSEKWRWKKLFPRRITILRKNIRKNIQLLK